VSQSITGSLCSRWYPAGCRFLILAVAVVGTAGFYGAEGNVLGSLSAVGAVHLRGIPVSREATLFAGDRIETFESAYARVRLSAGPEFEFGQATDVRIGSDELGVRVMLGAGRMAFSSPSSAAPVTVSVESFRIEAPRGSAAELAFLAPNRLSVRALEENLVVTALAFQETETVQEGEQVIINLDAEIQPAESPEEPPQVLPAEESSSTKWILIGAGGGGAAGAVIFVAGGDKNSASPIQP